MEIEYDRDPDQVYEASLERGRLPRNDALKQIVLERIVDQFEMGEEYDKRELDEVLEPAFEDHVLVRRELVNFGYMKHDNTENTYLVRKTELSAEDYRANTRLKRHAKDLGLIE